LEADAGEGVQERPRADRHRAVEVVIPQQPHPRAERDSAAQGAIRADYGVVGQFALGGNHRGRMNRGHRGGWYRPRPPDTRPGEISPVGRPGEARRTSRAAAERVGDWSGVRSCTMTAPIQLDILDLGRMAYAEAYAEQR